MRLVIAGQAMLQLHLLILIQEIHTWEMLILLLRINYVVILIEKEFVANEVHGRNHYYFPIVSKQDYKSGSINNIVENYFDGSFKEVVSFMIDKKKLKLKDIELLLNQLKSKK